MRTVAAVSTPRGKGGVALIRVSGDDALAVAGRCFRSRGGKSLAGFKPRSAVYGTVYAGDVHDDASEKATGSPIDDGVRAAADIINSTTVDDGIGTDTDIINSTPVDDGIGAAADIINTTPVDDGIGAVADIINSTPVDDGIGAVTDITNSTPVDDGIGAVADIINSTPVDDVIAIYFAAPMSYTGEDTVEFTCHGGVAVTAAVLEAVYTAGAYPAEAGEFTRRAYINGRLSLTEAEAVGRLIDADTDARRALAYSNVSGRLAGTVSSLSEKLTGTLAKLYASIDYPDEDLDEFDISELTAVFTGVRDGLLTLCRTYRAGRAITEGVRTVIVGKPNAGKSSLFNLLTCSERSIVTAVPGTTRDYIEAVATVGGVTLNLTDTAGIRDGGGDIDEVERLGIERSRKQLAGAELVLFVADAEDGMTSGDAEILAAVKSSGAQVIAMLNKCDAVSADAVAESKAAVVKSLAEFDIAADIISISVSRGDGVSTLEAAVGDLFVRGVDVKNDAVVTEARQSASLSRAASFLSDAVDALRGGYAPDIAGVSVENAIAELDLTDGRNIGEDIVAEIFSRFCVGK